MEPTMCQWPDCTTRSFAHVGLCAHHWSQIGGGFRNLLQTTWLVVGESSKYDRTLERVISSTAYAQRADIMEETQPQPYIERGPYQRRLPGT